MSLSTQDLLHGVDMTGINPVAASDLNHLIDLSAPVLDDSSNGKGLNLWTIDSAVGVPIVPNATVTTKWKRYLWIRIPNVGDSNTIPFVYAWNDNASSISTYLKWQKIAIDKTYVDTQIAAVSTVANTAQTTATTALNLSTSNVTQSQQALTNSIAAQNDATNALAQATAANTLSTTLQTNLATTNSTLATVQTTANTALNNTNALPVANLVAGASGQRLRTNDGATAVQWYNDPDNYVKLTESHASGVNGAVTGGATWNRRVLTTVNNNSGSLVSLNAGTGAITFNNAGTYRINVRSTVGGNVNGHQLRFTNGAAKVIYGLSENNATGSSDTAYLLGIVTASLSEVFFVDHYTQSAVGSGGMGLAASSGAGEVYCEVEIVRIQ